MKKAVDNCTSDAELSRRDDLEFRKGLREKMRQLHKKLRGDGDHSPSNPIPRLPGEKAPARNKRLIDRYNALLLLNEGRSHGLITQVAREFGLTRQYVSEKALKSIKAKPAKSR